MDDRLGDLPGWALEGSGEPKRDVGGEVAVAGVAGTVELDLGLGEAQLGDDLVQCFPQAVRAARQDCAPDALDGLLNDGDLAGMDRESVIDCAPVG